MIPRQRIQIPPRYAILRRKDNIPNLCQDLPPWIPAVTQHTTSGIGDKAELHMIRAVNTGVINVCFPYSSRQIAS